MSRKNKKGRWQEFQWADKDKLPNIPIANPPKPKPKKARSRCAFCGRLLGVHTWHWVWDEFGQKVKKCNDEWTCRHRRKDAAEKAYRNALIRSRAYGRPFWQAPDDDIKEE